MIIQDMPLQGDVYMEHSGPNEEKRAVRFHQNTLNDGFEDTEPVEMWIRQGTTLDQFMKCLDNIKAVAIENWRALCVAGQDERSVDL